MIKVIGHKCPHLDTQFAMTIQQLRKGQKSIRWAIVFFNVGKSLLYKLNVFAPGFWFIAYFCKLLFRVKGVKK